MDWQIIIVLTVLVLVVFRAFYLIWRKIKNVDNPCCGCDGCNTRRVGQLQGKGKCRNDSRKGIKYLRE